MLKEDAKVAEAQDEYLIEQYNRVRRARGVKAAHRYLSQLRPELRDRIKDVVLTLDAMTSESKESQAASLP